jgi:tetratricopeptide (TPR) repeat protein
MLLSLALGGCWWLPGKGMAVAIQGNTSFEATYHYSLGVMLALDENLDGAIEEFETSIRFDPASPYLAAELATLYMEKGDFQKAVDLCNKSISYNPEDIHTYVLLGGIYLSIKDFEKAAHIYKKIIQLDPKHVAAHLYLGTIYAEIKRFDMATDIFKKLISIDPDHLMGNYYSAKTLFEMKRYDEAEQGFKRTLAIKQSFEPALIDLGILYEKQKKNALAIDTYRNYINLYPTRTNVRIKLGELFIREQKYGEAERVLKEFLAVDHTNRDVRFTLGLVYFDSRQYDRAVDEFSLLVTKNQEDHRARFLLASTYEEKKSYHQAFEEFSRIPPDTEFYINAQMHLGMILKSEGKIDAAVAVINKAILNSKGSPGLYIFLSSLYEENKNIESAEETLKQGLRIAPKHIDLHYSLGVLYEKTNRFNESIREMETVLEYDPENAEAFNFIGYTYADRGIQLEKAEALIKKALELKPGNGYMIDSLGWVYFRQNRTDLAIKYLKEASDKMPNDPTIAEHLADAYTKAGMIREAIETYRQTLKISPDSHHLKKKLDALLKKGNP